MCRSFVDDKIPGLEFNPLTGAVRFALNSYSEEAKTLAFQIEYNVRKCFSSTILDRVALKERGVGTWIQLARSEVIIRTIRAIRAEYI